MPKKKTFYIELSEMDFVTLLPLVTNKEEVQRAYKSMQPGDSLTLQPANALSFYREGSTIILTNKEESDAGDRQDQDS